MSTFKSLISYAVLAAITLPSFGQSKPKLFFREDWKETEAALPVTQEHVAHADLILNLYGPASNSIKKSHHPQIPHDPWYIWSGECKGNWAVGLSFRNKAVNLGNGGKVRIRSRQSGFRELRIILKLASGEWLVSDQSAGYTKEWTEKEFRVADIHWRKLNVKTVIEGDWVDHPDLSKVEEVGFTDLMTGGGTPASSRLDWIEVYGQPANH